jgi:hypothetical protein
MSEYQYYEFAAIDKPLTASQMATLRERSSRATITPAGFTNHYTWGDLKGNPLDWMRRYFDAHVYVANWCSCWLYLRLPADVIDDRTMSEYAMQDALTVDRGKEHRILQWTLSESEDDDRFAQEDGSGWMARLLPLRDELLRGDLRALYLGWLAGVCYQEVADDAVEPPPPRGLSRLTGAQQSLVAFLDIDEDLVTAAGAADAQAFDAGDADVADVIHGAAQDAWLAQWPADERTAVLKLLLDGRGQEAERKLKSAFLSWRRAQRPPTATATARRTVAELRSLADGAAAVRQKKDAAKRKRAEAARQAERDTRLRIMAKHFDSHWRAADKDAQRGVASGYEAARRTIGDLADAYTLCSTRADFDRALADFMLRHGTRSALVKRLVEAGLWRKMI